MKEVCELEKKIGNLEFQKTLMIILVLPFLPFLLLLLIIYYNCDTDVTLYYAMKEDHAMHLVSSAFCGWLPLNALDVKCSA